MSRPDRTPFQRCHALKELVMLGCDSGWLLKGLGGHLASASVGVESIGLSKGIGPIAHQYRLP